MIRDDFQMDPPPPPPPPEGNLNNCQMPRATAAGRYHVLSWLASSQASFVVRASPNPVLLPFVRPRVSPLPFQNQFVFRSHVPCRSPFPSIWLVNVVCIYFAEPGEDRTPGFPGTGANLRLRERAKGALLPSSRTSTAEGRKEKKKERSTRISPSRERTSFDISTIWTNVSRNSKKVSNSRRDRVSRSTRKRLRQLFS